jgi:hypothetical protein
MFEQYSWSRKVFTQRRNAYVIEKTDFAHLRVSASKGVLARGSEGTMDPKIAQEILDDLIPSLEELEAKSTAVLEFLKHEGIASDEKLAPYLEQAAGASNVRWLGVRVRIERLLTAAEKDSAKKRTAEEEKKSPPAQTKAAERSESQAEADDNSKSAGPEKPNENTEKDKNAETTRKNRESKSKVETTDSRRRDKKDERIEISADKPKSEVNTAEQKVA